jgi:hypothetical protein
MAAGAVLGALLGFFVGRSASARTAVVLTLLLGSLFVAYRGVAYYQCRSACGNRVDCAAKAERENPFRGLGGRNDIGRVLCEQSVDLCISRCALL